MERARTLKNNISIVLPCYNPIANWDENVLNNYKVIKKNLPNVALEIVLINDGSIQRVHDENIKKLEAEIENFKFVSYSKNKGKGYAVREGFKNASHDYIVFTDIDFPYTSESIINMVNKLFKSEGDIIVGVRNKNYYRSIPFYRKLISKLLINLNKFLLNLPVGETQAGLKAFSKKGKEAMLLSKIDGYLFDIEVLKIGKNMKCKIITSEVSLRNEIIFSKMGIKTLIKEFLNYLKIIFKV